MTIVLLRCFDNVEATVHGFLPRRAEMLEGHYLKLLRFSRN